MAGPSGSGKTAFSEKIKGLMPGVAIISMGEAGWERVGKRRVELKGHAEGARSC